MRYVLALVFGGLVVSTAAFLAYAQAQQSGAQPQWSMKATAIEACSCPMFCQCYFSDKPAGHAVAKAADSAHAGHAHHSAADAEHFCRFNMAYRVDSGHHGDTRLDGAKFWISGDLGETWSDGQAEWSMLTFDPSVTPAQREGIKAALAGVFTVKWNKFVIGEDKPIEWRVGSDKAHAKLDDGKAAEVILKRNPSAMSEGPTVIQNLKYWSAPRNAGFVLMPNELNATHVTPEGIKPFEFKDSNGFMITWDINSNDIAQRAAAN